MLLLCLINCSASMQTSVPLMQVCGVEKQAGGASLATGAMRPAHDVDQMVGCMGGLAVTKPGATYSVNFTCLHAHAVHTRTHDEAQPTTCLLPAGRTNQPLSGSSARAMPGMPSQQAGIFQRQGASLNGMARSACLQSQLTRLHSPCLCCAHAKKYGVGGAR